MSTKRAAQAVADPKRYCAIVFIGCGSSWLWGGDPDEVVRGAARIAKSDWSTLYKFKRRHEFTVCLVDMAGREGWYATDGAIYDRDTKERLTPEVRKVIA